MATSKFSPPVTVGDLRDLIRDLPDDAPVLERRYSDLGLVQPDTFSVIDAVVQSGGEWYQLSRQTGLPAGSRVVRALFYAGN